MKFFKELAAAALAGVMALSMLTGCTLGEAAKENAMLKALQTAGNMMCVKVSEDKDLSKKAHGVFSAFKAAEGKEWDAERPDDENLNIFIAKVVYKEIPYLVAVTEMPNNAKDSINWGYTVAKIWNGFERYKCIEWDNEEETSGKLKVGFDVMNDAKLTDTQEKAEDYMVVFAKCLNSAPEQTAPGRCVRLYVYRFCCFRRVMKSSASMASGVKLLLFHQLARAAATVRPLEMSCSSWALSMGNMGLPTALST